MTITITLTMTGMEAVRIFNERETDKYPGAKPQRIHHKKRTSLPIHYNFPYRYVFPANHPHSSHAQFLRPPAAATPQYNSGGGIGSGSPGNSMYAQAPPFIPSHNQHQHQHQHQLQHLSQMQPPQPPPSRPNFEHTPQPGATANGQYQQQHTATSNNAHLGPFHGSSAAPTILLLHAANPAIGSVQTYFLIPTSTTNGGQSHGVGPAISPDLLNALAFPPRGIGGGGSGTQPAAAQTPIPGPPATAPIMMRPPSTNSANGHFLNQLSAAQLMSRPVNGGVYQLPLKPTNQKYYKRKQSSIKAKMRHADSDQTPHASGDPHSSLTESTTSPIRNGHAPHVPDQDDTSLDAFEE